MSGSATEESAQRPSASVLVSAGLGEEDAAGLAHLFTEALDGRNANLESGVKDVLGREPRDFTAFAERALALVALG